ncbi:MAG: dTDP-4-dehydrorhamnose 3,5-epimerase [Bacteroidales bacterium]
MKVTPTEIPDILLLEPRLFYDERGYFMEFFSQRKLEALLPNIHFVQENQSLSGYGVLRGLHYQLPPFAQSKLVRVVLGSALDVAVDIREGSPTFGKYVATLLSKENHLMMYIPRGFAHGFLALEPNTIFQYKCDNYYSPDHEASIAWDDPTIGVEWGMARSKLIVSDKDKNLPSLMEAPHFLKDQKLY